MGVLNSCSEAVELLKNLVILYHMYDLVFITCMTLLYHMYDLVFLEFSSCPDKVSFLVISFLCFSLNAAKFGGLWADLAERYIKVCLYWWRNSWHVVEILNYVLKMKKCWTSKQALSPHWIANIIAEAELGQDAEN